MLQVPEAYITRLELIPNIDEETISVLVHGSKAAKDAPFRAEVTASGSSITAAKGKVGKQLVISIPKPKLWSPESPFLYDLEITLEADSPHAVVSLLFYKLFLAAIYTGNLMLKAFSFAVIQQRDFKVPHLSKVAYSQAHSRNRPRSE